MSMPQHRYETYVRASQAEVWAAITDPVHTRRYFHRTAVESTFEVGGPIRYVLPDGTVASEGVVEHHDPPHRLVMTWRSLYDRGMAAEPESRVEWQLRPADDLGTVTLVIVRHFDLAKSPLTSANVEHGWTAILDSMKTLLETGEAPEPHNPPDPAATAGAPLS